MANYTLTIETRIDPIRFALLRYWCVPIIATMRDCGADVSDIVDSVYAQMLDCVSWRVSGGKWEKLTS